MECCTERERQKGCQHLGCSPHDHLADWELQLPLPSITREDHPEPHVTRPDAEKLLARNENTTEVKTAASHVCAGQTRGGGAPGNVPLSAGTRKSRGRGVGHPRRSPHCGTNPRPHAQPQTAPGTPLAPPRLGLPPCAFTRCPACNTKLPDS